MQHWGWGERMVEEAEPFDPILTFFADEDARTAFLIFGVALLLITAKVYYSIGIKDSEVLVSLNKWKDSAKGPSHGSQKTRLGIFRLHKFFQK